MWPFFKKKIQLNQTEIAIESLTGQQPRHACRSFSSHLEHLKVLDGDTETSETLEPFQWRCECQSPREILEFFTLMLPVTGKVSFIL